MKAISLVCLVLLAAGSIAAQSTEPCPVGAVVSAVEKVDPGAPITFMARTNDGVSIEKLKYTWRVSAGTITYGQNTFFITVDTAGLGGQSVTATVEVVGMGSSCRPMSRTVEVAPPIICRLKFDEYGDISVKDERARLDNFAIQVINSAPARGLIIMYAGNPTYKGETSDQLRRIKSYLVRTRGIPPEKVVVVDGGYRNDLTVELHLLYPHEVMPTPESTVKLAEVKFTKRRPATKRRTKTYP